MGPGSHGNSEHHKHSDFSVVLELLSWMGGIANGINESLQWSKDTGCEEDGAFAGRASICTSGTYMLGHFGVSVEQGQ